MQLLRVIAFFLAVITVGACSSAPKGPPTVGETKDFNAVCEKANDSKRIAVVGYLRFPEEFKGVQSVMLRLYETNDLGGRPIGVETKIGRQANQVELAPKTYTDKDLKVHLSNEQVAPFGTKVKVSGDVYFPIVGQTFACGLSNPLVELEK
jgi:hypothetical protein